MLIITEISDDTLQVKCNGYTDDVNVDFYPGTLKPKLSSNKRINVDILDINIEIRNNNLVTINVSTMTLKQ